MKTLSDKIRIGYFKEKGLGGDFKVILLQDIKEFIKWVETEIILKSPKRRQNLIKLKNRVGEKLI